MRILHVGKYYPPALGGMETFLRDLAEAQVKAGHQVSVLVHGEGWHPGTSRQHMAGVEVIRAACFGTLAYAPVAPTFGALLAAEIRTMRPDVLHVHMPNTSPFWLLGMGRLPPLVLHWHSDVVASDLSRSLRLLHGAYSALERRLLHKADMVLATSQPYLESSEPLTPFMDKCTAVPLGIDAERLPSPGSDAINACREKYGNAPLVVSAGRFSYYKGFSVLLRAARLLTQAQFVIVGNGPLHDQMKHQRDALGLAERVHLPGSLSDQDLHTHMAACDVFCLPSLERTEAFGLVLVEAMSHGRPLVTTEIPGSGVGFVNQDGKTGLTAPPGDEEALAKRIEELLDDRDFAATLGEQGRIRFKEEFCIQACATAIEERYTLLSPLS